MKSIRKPFFYFFIGWIAAFSITGFAIFYDHTLYWIVPMVLWVILLGNAYYAMSSCYHSGSINGMKYGNLYK